MAETQDTKDPATQGKQPTIYEQILAKRAAEAAATGTASPKPLEPKSEVKKEEVELVEVTQFMDQTGVRYFAKKAKDVNDMTFPHVKKMVEKGSEEDK